MRDLASVASEAADSFQSFKRPGDDDTTLYRVKDGAPAWIGEMVRAAHGEGMLPDDWRYECVLDALHFLADNADMDEGADHEFADQKVDVYTASRFAWLATHLNRQWYVDEAMSEFGATDSVADAIGQGQYLEAREVFAIVRAALVERLDEGEDEDDELEFVLIAPGFVEVRHPAGNWNGIAGVTDRFAFNHDEGDTFEAAVQSYRDDERG